jgi:glutaconate CoA-transferase, subunit B
VLEPDPDSRELVLTHLHRGASADDARAATGWELRVSPTLRETEGPTPRELAALRALKPATRDGRGG